MPNITDKKNVRKSDNLSQSASAVLKSSYKQFIQQASDLFPKVDQKLLMNIVQFEAAYDDWEGSVLLKIVYPADTVDIDAKKDFIYNKYQRVPTVEADKTLRFKGIRIYVEELEKMLNEDPDIQYITGSATLTPSDAYSA
ncbi:MAG TPA: hypothetical protein VJ729_05630 [Nitrososphaeraceae archaeon]|nr:hypothetical protein [Nitrososphaeraceae archaeon]